MTVWATGMGVIIAFLCGAIAQSGEKGPTVTVVSIATGAFILWSIACMAFTIGQEVGKEKNK